MEGREHGRIALREGKYLALEVLGRQHSQRVAGSDAASRHAKNQKVGRPCFQRVVEFASLDALVNGEVELAQNFAQELADVVLCVRDAD